jgi:tRNA threonylcarbamoyladenosine biosynthesis protein TsaE
MTDRDLELALPNDEATDELGAALARGFPGAQAAGSALHLKGDLGAGKTRCVRSMLRTWGVAGLIRSPTFTLVETYPLGALTCVHADLYRLGGPLEVEALGLREYMSPAHLLLVEWPEKAGGALPLADLELTLEFAGGGRHARLHPGTPLGVHWLHNLRSDSRLISYLTNLT